MDDKQKGLIPELGDSHMSHSWAPQTPAKPGKIKPHQICTEPQNYEALHTIRVESDEFLQKNQMGQSEIDQTRKLEGILQENMDACLDSENAFEIFRSFSNWEAYKAMETQVNEDNLWGSKIAGDDGQMPFLELLAKVDNRLSTNTSGNCSLVNNPGDGSCLSINLNLPSNFFEVAPITPEKTMRNDGRRGLVMQNLSPDAIRSTKDMQQKEIHTERVESEGILQKKEQSQLVTNDISEANSMQLEENHKPDKGGTEDVDLSKTPQQKPRRRKHRPKVIIEGQSQKTPKRKVGRPPGPQGTAKGKRKGVNNNPATATPPETIDGKHTNANNAPSSQETTTAKRKYVRRNTKATTPEAEIKGKDTNSNVPSSQETTTGKRKYVKRKEVNKPTVSTPDEETRETTEPKIAQKTRTTCKRSLNFDIEVEVRDESSLHQNPPPNSDMESQAQNFNAKDQSGSNTQYAQVSEGTLRKTEVNSAYDLTFSTEQEMEGYLSKPKGHSSSPSHRSKTDTLHDKSTLMDQKVCTRGKCPVLFTDKITPANQKVRTRGKCQILFTDKTVDGEGNSTRFIMKSDAQSTQKSPSDSGSSSTACLTEERIERGQKRQHTGTTVEAEPCRLNLSGTLYNSMQAYNAIFPQNAYVDCIPGMHFPAMYSTKRIEKVQNSLTSSMHSIVIAPENRAMAADDDTQNKQKRFKYLSDLGPTERLDKGKSKEPAPVWNLESLPEICGQLQASAGSGATTSKTTDGFGILQQPQKKKSKGHTHDAKAITVDASARTVTKKRPKKSLHINSTVQHMHADHHFVARSMGPPLAITWMCNSLVDAIALMTEQFNQLDLNAKSGKEHDAFTANYMDYQEQHALVPYQRNGALIPFDGSFDQVKRSRPRPKVDIDDETSRVWKLLLENINNEGIDGTDEEKEKWWEEERRVFRGRADSFIARMHLVQGDRRFSPWKGSVLDSVVGVFLTQNVSDHLSSSAFMSLAARFPFESESSRGQSCREKVNITINGPEVHDLDTVDTFGWNEGFNKPPCSEVPKMLDNDTGEVNNFRFPGENFIGALPKDKLSHQLTDISKNAPDTSRESAVNKIGLIGDEKDLDDTLSSQNSVISSQNSADSVIAQSAERPESCSPRTLEAERAAGSNSNSPSTSDQKPSQNQNGVHNQEDGNRLCNMDGRIEPGSLAPNPQNEKENLLDVTCSEPALHLMPTSGEQAEQYNIHPKNGKGSNITDANELCESEISGLSAESAAPATIQKFLAINPEVLKISSEEIQSSNARQGHMYRDTAENPAGRAQSVYHGQENNYQMQEVPNIPTQNLTDITGSSNIDNSRIPENTEIGLNLKDPGKTASEPKAKGGRTKKEKPKPVDWDNLRKQAQEGGRRRERTANTMDSVDWEAVRCAHVSDVAETIKERGMNNVLAGRIQDFLNRLVRDHGSTDLEWLRDVPPDKAKEYLLSVRGLGLKSVECVRLLTLHHLAFPVDTNVGRIVVRLGWVPLQPLPESLQLHLLELYPVLESIQQYLWPRLCKLDQRTLYELHYQMITFGKVFCTKSKPNCNACPMRGECRHFASAFASARLALPGTEDKSIMSAVQNNSANQNPVKIINPLQLPLPQANQLESCAEASNSEPIIEVPATPEPIIEVPASPEPDQTQAQECDIEDNDFEDPDDIPTIQLNMEQFTHNLQSFMQNQMELQEGDMSKALVALTPEAASIPVPKLKNVSRLRTEHQVYELPDAHPLLQTMDKREPDDPCSYLLAIWTPGETADSIQPPEGQCSSQDCGNLCTNETCFSCNSIREGNSQTVRGTLLIPCRTAMRGSFPLNGTYFQVNEVFADHESSLNPINVPREWLWNLPRRTVYFGTSIPTIFKGLSTEGIQYCFWRGFVCVRGFDSKTRAPRPLIARLHFPASKLAKAK